MRFPCNKFPAGKGNVFSAGTELVLFLNDSLVTLRLCMLTAFKVNLLCCVGLNKSFLNWYLIIVTYKQLFVSIPELVQAL